MNIMGRKTFRANVHMHDGNQSLSVADEVAYFDTDENGNLIMVLYGGEDGLMHASVTFIRADLQNFIDEFKSSLTNPTQPGKYRAIQSDR